MARPYLFWMWKSLSKSDSHETSRAETTLAAYLRGGRLPHAILVEGHADTISFAHKIAKAALCRSEEDKPCGTCKDCRKAEKGVHPDILVYSGGESAKSFHIDTVRKLRQEAYIKPNEAEGKVFILENVQNMTVQAQNALLKIIEEPPYGVTFILTCENKSALLVTVLSRVSVFSLDVTTEEPDENEADEAAKKTLDDLLFGSELKALAAFSAYEKDRPAFARFLSSLRGEAVSRMLLNAKSEKLNRDEQIRLTKLVEIINEIETGLKQNVGGLLMTAILPASFKCLDADRRG